MFWPPWKQSGKVQNCPEIEDNVTTFTKDIPDLIVGAILDKNSAQCEGDLYLK